MSPSPPGSLTSARSAVRSAARARAPSCSAPNPSPKSPMTHMPLDASVMAAVDTDSAHGERRTSRCGSRWVVVHTHPQAERRAAQNLEHQGYQAYLPPRTVRSRDRVLPTLIRPVERPLFPLRVRAVPQTHGGPSQHTRRLALLRRPGNTESSARGVWKRYRRWTHFAAPSHRPEPRGRLACLAAPPRGRSQATQPSSSRSEGKEPNRHATVRGIETRPGRCALSRGERLVTHTAGRNSGLPRSSTSFQPGQSGNPGGRPKGIEALSSRTHRRSPPNPR